MVLIPMRISSNFNSDSVVFSANKTDRNYIKEILLKRALNTIPTIIHKYVYMILNP
jgi:hypothetical protein